VAQKYTLVSFAELHANPPQLPPSLWGGDDCWIVHPSLVLVDGDTKVGKSLFAMQLGEALLDPTRESWLGKPVGYVQRVLYLNAEVSQPFTLVRAHKMWRERVAGLSGLITLEERGFRLDKNDGFLDSVTRDSHADVVIIDPLDRFHDQDMNNPQMAGMVLGVIENVIDRRGVTVILVHHWNKTQNKDGRSAFTRARGSTRLVGDADSHFVISRAGVPLGAVILDAQLRHGEWNRDLLLHRDRESLIFHLPDDKPAETDVSERIMSVLALSACGRSRKEVVTDLRKILRYSEAKADATLDDALARGLLYKDTKGDLYAGTPPGRHDAQDSAGGPQ
jgi:hypothetical protein